MGAKTATVIGATGLTGGHIVQLLQQENYYQQIRLLVRKPLANNHTRTEVKLIDFGDRESFKIGVDGSDVVFCAIGTTQKKVKGDRGSYRKVDYDIPVNAATFCKETGCYNFVLVSAVGANAASNNFYLKLKGETEEAIRKINIPSVAVFRPSFLLGERKEWRLGESLAKAVMPVISMALAGKWRKYKPVAAKTLASAMIQAARQGTTGFHVLEYDAIMKLAKTK